MVMSGSMNANTRSPFMLKKALSMTLPTDERDLNFLGRERMGVFIACLQLFPWVESGGTMSHHLPQSVAKAHRLLSGSTANVRATVPYATICDCL
jgi:hypothetical protein